ncbi:hypothetical protein XENOCAPTIV_015972, partial [Xenoophorus captivus]
KRSDNQMACRHHLMVMKNGLLQDAPFFAVLYQVLLTVDRVRLIPPGKSTPELPPVQSLLETARRAFWIIIKRGQYKAESRQESCVVLTETHPLLRSSPF